MFLIIGNILSLFAAVFTVLSSISCGRKKIYGYQACQCAVMIAASVFFGSISGVVTFAFCVLRNILLMNDRFSKTVCAVFIALLSITGILSNNLGFIGLIPVAATVLYTFLCLILREDIAIKLNIILNLALWTVYDFIIFDIVSATVDAISVIVTIISVAKALKLSSQNT